MHKSLLALLILSTVGAASAQESTIYRWVDSNNVVHFSHEHPTDKDYAQIDVQVSYAPVAKKAEDSENEENENENENTDGDQLPQNSKEMIKQNCESAKLNLKTLGDYEKVFYKDLEGNSRLLSAEEKTEQMALSQKYVDVFCNDESNQ
ncbi:DUF4124 domain-containing protein [Thalassotalea sp. M1531]|uniref:DUF4124 domain-containing protein n=1 Tax=Thalassotalea algicola TaxID=2716224 RepID=A0A7Y0LFQ0_9GAMM|nr:DUF4124 domain-containing protein [Thalassotalea algicola]NMP32866.1 DUF4124 domain-containing protein [Thalassotalea algicola]